MIEQSSLSKAAGAAFKLGFDAVLKIEPDDAAAFGVDGRGDFCVLTEQCADADCVWKASADTLMRVFEGGRALESAYLSGRLRIAGDMSVMARLELESSR